MIRLESNIARLPLRCIAFAPVAFAAGLASIWVAREQGTGIWPILAFGLMPDIALFAGIGTGLAKGQLHRRAVLPYNLLHSFVGPALLAAVALILHFDSVWPVGALAWATHISVDRAAGYGMRNANGFQRD